MVGTKPLNRFDQDWFLAFQYPIVRIDGWNREEEFAEAGKPRAFSILLCGSMVGTRTREDGPLV